MGKKRIENDWEASHFLENNMTSFKRLTKRNNPDRLLFKWRAHTIYITESAPSEYVQLASTLVGENLIEWQLALCRRMLTGTPLPIKDGGKAVLVIANAAYSIREKKPIQLLKIDLGANMVWYKLNDSKKPNRPSAIEKACKTAIYTSRMERQLDFITFEDKVVNMKWNEWSRRYSALVDRIETLQQAVEENKAYTIARLTDFSVNNRRLALRVEAVGPTTRSLQNQIDLLRGNDEIEISDGESVEWDGFA